MSTKVRIGPLRELPDGRGVRVEVGEHRIAVFRIDTEVYAIGDRCSHAEASLAEGDIYGLEVECPRHGSEFSIVTGNPSSFPATRPVPVYKAFVEDGNVVIAVGEESPVGGEAT